MSSILETLAAAEESRARVAEEAYFALVELIADDNSESGATLDDVQAVLAAANRTASHLANNVSARKHENGLRAIIAERDAALVEREGINKKIADSVAGLDAAKQLHITTCRPLEFRLQEIIALINRGADAERELGQRQKGKSG